MTRILTSIVGIPVLIYLVKFAPSPVFLLIAYLAMLVAVYEYFTLIRLTGRPSFPWLGCALASVLMLSFYFTTLKIEFYFPLSALLVLSAALLSRLDPEAGLHASAFTILGAWYVGGLMGCLVGVRMVDSGGETGSDLLMMLFVIIWAGDIFAYLVGKAIGRRRLAAVSPKKTVEGAVGGLVFSILSAIACRYFFAGQISVLHAAVLGTVVGVLGQIGDLCESILKRAAKAKDSGTIIPGHGGILDRIDSLLFGAPAMYYYFYLFLHR